MNHLIAFGAAFGLSFLGMLPPGMLNMTVVSLSMKKNMFAASLFAFGAALVEFFQVFLIVYFIEPVNHFLNENVFVYWIALFILLGLGGYYLISKPKKVDTSVSLKINYYGAFLQGMSLSIINVLAYVFWLMSGVYFLNEGILYSDLSILLIYSLGVMSGAFVAYMIYAYLGDKILNQYDFFVENINKIIAIIFFILASLQLFKILN